MSRFSLDADSPFMRILAQVGDLMLVNILFLFCSLPVVTAGASAAALYTVTLGMARHDSAHAGKTFLRAFKSNLPQATVLTLLFLAVGAGLYAGLRVMQANPAAFPFVFRVGFGVFTVVYLLTLSFTFPIQARFSNTVWKTLKNAFLLAATHPLRALLITLCTLLPFGLLVFATYYFLLSSVFWFLFGFSCLALLNSVFFTRMFRKVSGDATA